MLHTPLPKTTQMDLEAQRVFNFSKFDSPKTASYALKCIKQSIAKYTIEDLEQDDLQVRWSESSLTTTDLGPDSELQSLQSLSIVRCYDAELQNEIKTNEILTTVAFHGRMAHDLEACYFDSPSSSNGDRTSAGLGSELLDIRLVASTGRLHDLRGGRTIAAKLALHIRLAKRARFGVIFAPPYFVLVESVVVDRQSHLLVGDLHSIVFDPDEPRATVKPFNAIFLALLMNHHVDYRIASPPQHVLNNVVRYSRSLDSAPEADNASALDHPPIVSSNSSDDPFRLSPGACHASLPGDDDSVKNAESKNARSEPDGPSKLFTCNGVTATLHLAPGQTIICDAKIIPDSRMAASPIELRLEYETASSSLSETLRAKKKIRLDAEASRRSNLVSEALSPELQQLFKRASTFVLHKREFKVKFAPPSGSRLDLVRRIGRGASSTVWQVQWVRKGVASGRPHVTRRSSCVGVGQGKLVAKIVSEDFAPSIAKEYYVYTSIVPLLSLKVRQYFPAFYGLYQSGTEGHAYVLVMEDAGSTISPEQLQLNSELKAKVDAALKLIADEGLVHGDEGARNVLLRPDGRICLFDWVRRY
ncbi:hypothetical protein MVLG_07136 [Microbotryum lychnidis-dioicae p1A1 Lamole]|uniref:Protein kinase domain-containing protein n=1 Tax=Microbotryum lychnidis-dioicae (strain p1A1 Lamole / MvSl-1064) TaxID=683840 RepID=U5HJF4_USTV1|nr:hypothetical protein MVLG_07136 [Microbotryum lychnidis-dioicae p1A1 Lamole]|eukprot:KDE02300.1 hypothetical protein MVLG_07136 [Microbotryum lychnidis-dioicae p1A1 Lamole]